MVVKEYLFKDFIEKNAVEVPNDIALAEENKTITYSQLEYAIDACTSKLLEMGVQQGDHVALLGYNSINWLVSFFAIVKAGAVATLLNYSLKEKDLLHQMNLADVKYILYADSKILSKNPNVILYMAKELCIPNENLLDFGKIDFEKEKISKRPNFKDTSKRTALINFTTGTTENSKAVQLSQYSCCNDAIATFNQISDDVGNSYCEILPLFHSFGFTFALFYIIYRKLVVLPQFFKPENIARLVAKYQTSDFASVGTIYQKLVEYEYFKTKVAPYVRFAVVGGGVSTSSQITQIEQCFENCKFVQGYGLTESSPVVTIGCGKDTLESRSSSVGKPLKNLEVRIVNKQKEDVKQGTSGEIIVRGYSLMNGYYKLPIEKQPIDSEGWLHTGDLGFFDENGYIHLSGRLKEIIIKNGENISPLEIERELIKLDIVKDAKVIGYLHPVVGEDIAACVVLNNEITNYEEVLQNSLKDVLSSIKIPSHFIVFNQFPLNENGKINVRLLKEKLLKKLIKFL